MHSFYLFFFIVWATVFVVGLPLPERALNFSYIESRTTRWGRATWYHPGRGNCGGWNNDNDIIVAISKRLYDNDGGSNCGQYVQVINTDNGKSAYGLVVDSCQSCGEADLDISPALFSRLDDPNKGVVTVAWHFMGRGWTPY